MSDPDNVELDIVEQEGKEAADAEGAVEQQAEVAIEQQAKDEEEGARPGSAEQNTASLTVGGLGHVFRRVYHIVLFTLVSYVYYFHGIGVASSAIAPDHAFPGVEWGEDIGFSSRKFISIVLLVQV
jgi:hypothetical protein